MFVQYVTTILPAVSEIIQMVSRITSCLLLCTVFVWKSEYASVHCAFWNCPMEQKSHVSSTFFNNNFKFKLLGDSASQWWYNIVLISKCLKSKFPAHKGTVFRQSLSLNWSAVTEPQTVFAVHDGGAMHPITLFKNSWTENHTGSNSLTGASALINVSNCGGMYSSTESY